jgi:hypothetical protein
MCRATSRVQRERSARRHDLLHEADPQRVVRVDLERVAEADDARQALRAAVGELHRELMVDVVVHRRAVQREERHAALLLDQKLRHRMPPRSAVRNI